MGTIKNRKVTPSQSEVSENLENYDEDQQSGVVMLSSSNDLPRYQAVSAVDDSNCLDVQLQQSLLNDQDLAYSTGESYVLALNHGIPKSSNQSEHGCEVLPGHVATFVVKKTGVKLSAMAAQVLCDQGLLKMEDLELYWPTEEITDPISGLASATKEICGEIIRGVTDYPIAIYEATKTKVDSHKNASSLSTDLVSPMAVPNNETLATFVTEKGVARIIRAGLKSPVTFTTALTRGFHNAPKLYNDDTVREQPVVTDMKSGLKGATQQFGIQLYDGLEGLVMHPVNGARSNGTTGFMTGVMKGLGGVVLKPCAAACGVPGYALLGVYKEIQNISKKKTMKMSTDYTSISERRQRDL